jgi:hypothetical protein
MFASRHVTTDSRNAPFCHEEDGGACFVVCFGVSFTQVKTMTKKIETPNSTTGRQGAHSALTPTINRDFANPVGSLADESLLSPQEIRARIFQYTTTAQILLKQGLSEPAFDALMKAYLLDPVNPDVIACEKSVLPVWENSRRLRTAGTTSKPLTDQERLQVLKAQKEGERLAKEREMWSKASSTNSRKDSPLNPRRR